MEIHYTGLGPCEIENPKCTTTNKEYTTCESCLRKIKKSEIKSPKEEIAKVIRKSRKLLKKLLTRTV